MDKPSRVSTNLICLKIRKKIVKEIKLSILVNIVNVLRLVKAFKTT